MKDEGKEARTLFLPFYPFTFLPLKIMPNDKKAYAQREKAYMQGKLFPQIKVGMTKVNLTPTVVKDERGIPHTEPNAPVYIYDTSGPYSDPNYQVDLRRACQECASSGFSTATIPSSSRRLPASMASSVLLTIASTTSASSTSSCLAVLRLASTSPRWLTPRRASSLQRWSMWLSART